MTFVSKRKARHIEVLALANQAKRQKRESTLGLEAELARVKLAGDTETKPTTNTLCTLVYPLSAQSNTVTSHPERSSDSRLTLNHPPLRFKFTSQSAGAPGSPMDREHCVDTRRAKYAPISSCAEGLGMPVPESVIIKQELEDEDNRMEFTPPVPNPVNRTHIDQLPPSRVDAEEALKKMNRLLYPPRKTGPGYKKSRLPMVLRVRYERMASCLRLYLRTNVTFTVASEQAAIGTDRSVWHSRRIRAWIRQFISSGASPKHKHSLSSRSLLNREDVAGEIKLFVQMKGKYFVASDIVQFLNDRETRQRLGIPKPITLRTVERWLNIMDYRWNNEKPGQYADGHEREDVVRHRQLVYAPKIKALEPRMMAWDDETGREMPPCLPDGQKIVVIWYHDTSTFYAHDRKKRGWHLRNSRSGLTPRGQGATAMVSDWVSAEFGFLKSRDGRSDARKILLAGKNREGYMTNADICAQFRRAVELVMREYPDRAHIFVYDNARIHTKRHPTAPTAMGMSKGESNFRITLIDASGKKTKVPMDNPKFPDGSEQELYLPNGRFKGMVELLRERGYDASGLKLECPGFKCADLKANCCCRQMMFNVIDTQSEQKAILQMLAEELEQVWGYAKGIYRKKPLSSLTSDVEKNMVDALRRVPDWYIRKFVARSHRFVDAYARGMDGPNAAAAEWARRKLRSHRRTPEHISV